VIAIQSKQILNPGAGGANEKISGHLINDYESAPPQPGTIPLLNVHTNTLGSIVRRMGYTVYCNLSATLAEITGLFQYKKFDGSEFEIVCGSNGSTKKIYNISTPASPVDITGSASITADSPFSFAICANILMLTTEARDTPLQWTGSSNVSTLSATAPAGKYCDEWDNYPIIANTAANPERVYVGPLFDPTGVWVATSFKILNGACTGTGKTDNNRFAFTRDSIYVANYTGDSLNPFQWEQLDTQIGCVSKRTIRNVEGVLYWLGPDGYFYRMKGVTPERVTEAVPQTTSQLNKASLSLSCAVDCKVDREYLCFLTKDSSVKNDFTVSVDYLANAIFFYDSIEANCCENFFDSNGSFRTYFGDRTGRVYLYNSGYSDYYEGTEQAISCYRYTKQFNLDSPNIKKRFRNVKATVNNIGSALSYITAYGDFGASGGEIVTVNHDGGENQLGVDWTLGTDPLGKSDYLPVDGDIAQVSKYIQLKYSCDELGNEVECRDISFQYQSLPRV
jgi:hypothetical protein